jgi:hypothetical protein
METPRSLKLLSGYTVCTKCSQSTAIFYFKLHCVVSMVKMSLKELRKCIAFIYRANHTNILQQGPSLNRHITKVTFDIKTPYSHNADCKQLRDSVTCLSPMQNLSSSAKFPIDSCQIYDSWQQKSWQPGGYFTKQYGVASDKLHKSVCIQTITVNSLRDASKTPRHKRCLRTSSRKKCTFSTSLKLL